MPVFIAWVTYKYIESNIDQIKCEICRDDYPNCDEHAHVRFSIGNENSEILKKNRKFDDEERWIINYC